MSKKRRYQPDSGSQSKKRARSVSFAQKGFSRASVAMWFGTTSSTTPSPASRAASQSARRPSSPPSSADTRVGSTTS